MQWYLRKTVSKGFIEALKVFIDEREAKAVEAKKPKRRTKNE